MSADLIERLERAAKNAGETMDWLANHEDAGCTPIWEAQTEYEEDAKAIREAADALAAKDAALSEITAENERLDASCTALDKYASEMMGRAEAAEAALSEMRAELERVKGALKPFAEAARKAGYYPHSHLLATREVTIQDFRRAASVLASQDDGEER